MQIYQGKPVFEGVAIGKIRIHKQEGQTIAFVKVEDIHKELERFGYARVEALKKLREWYHTVLIRLVRRMRLFLKPRRFFCLMRIMLGILRI